MRNRLATDTSIAIVAAALGFLLGKVLAVPGITWSTELNPLHALSIVVTLFIAVFFGVILSRRDRMNDVAKNLVIGKLGRIDEIMNEYQSKLADGTLTQGSASSFRKKVSGTFKCVWEEAGIEKFRKTRTLAEYESDIADIHNLLTWTEACDECDTRERDVQVRGGVMAFSGARIALLETKFGAFRNELFSLQIKVNSR